MGAFDGSMKKSTTVTVPEPTLKLMFLNKAFDPDDPNSKCGQEQSMMKIQTHAS